MLTGEPSYLQALLTRSADLQMRATRNMLAIPSVRTNYGKHSFMYCAPYFYNRLPPRLQSETDIAKFKKGLKTFLFSETYDLTTMIINDFYEV